jgi:catechol 2,3-dioxygenase-like lactoylglutathione lyase family enzyme
MSITLNHTIVWCKDQVKSASFIAEVLGLPVPRRFLHFLIVDLANHVSLDYYESMQHLAVQHYAFLVSDAEFDAIYQRIQNLNIPIWADPARAVPDQINHHFGGRGLYFVDPDGHLFEIITKPYGSEDELRAQP